MLPPRSHRMLRSRRSCRTALVTAHNVTVRAVPGPDSIYNSQQGWAVRAVGGYAGSAQAPGPWSITMGAGVRIAILDSGVDATHPDLAPNLALNLSEIDQTALPSACDDGSPQDQQGHGSWTASLAAAALGPNTGLVAGVAPPGHAAEHQGAGAHACDPDPCGPHGLHLRPGRRAALLGAPGNRRRGCEPRGHRLHVAWHPWWTSRPATARA